MRTDEQGRPLTDTETGPAVGVESTGVPAGGGALGGTLGGPTSGGAIGGTDTDTGLDFGPGQSTTTGTLATQGNSNMDGTGEVDTTQKDDPAQHRTTPRVTNGDLSLPDEDEPQEGDVDRSDDLSEGAARSGPLQSDTDSIDTDREGDNQDRTAGVRKAAGSAMDLE